VERFHMLGRTGFVSDDTEQAALLAQSLARHPDDLQTCVRDFRRALVGWCSRLPWGIGRATLQACLRIAVGQEPGGVPSAGNGAAMRAAILGGFFWDRPQERREWGHALARVTHTDARAVEGALYVAELATLCIAAPQQARRAVLAREALAVVTEPVLHAALERALLLAAEEIEVGEAAAELGTTGYVVHTVPFALFCFLRCGDEPLMALAQAIGAGGDTDSVAAILGGWLGAIHGERGLPTELIARIHDGPFGPTHLRALATALTARRDGQPAIVPGYSAPTALLRNLGLSAVVLAHVVRRLLP